MASIDLDVHTGSGEQLFVGSSVTFSSGFGGWSDFQQGKPSDGDQLLYTSPALFPNTTTTLEYALLNVGNQALFRVDTSMKHNGEVFFGEDTQANAHIVFTLFESVNYEIRGEFGGNDPNARYFFVTVFRDLSTTPTTNLFVESEQNAFLSGSNLLTLNNNRDGTGGSFANGFQTLTGTIGPGTYNLVVEFQAISGADSVQPFGTSGFTELRLFRDAPPTEAVPEPSTLTIAGLGCLTMFGAWRTRGSRRKLAA